MTIPDSTYYPDTIDTDENLYSVSDGLRLRLVKDYTPGDKSIMIEGDALILDRWPSTGILTLTDQCNDLDKRATSYFYSSVDKPNGIISSLEVMPGFSDTFKPKRITNVTQNVYDRHHNSLKDALIAIEDFIGVKGVIDTQPFGDTLEGRINFLRKLVLQPKAWFRANKRIGIVPFEVEFENLSFRLGTDGTAGPVTVIWDFGDNTSSTVSTISVTDAVEVGEDNILVYDIDGGKIKKTYLKPGLFNVKLTVRNQFGEDTCEFANFINPRIPAPNEAVVRYLNAEGQIATPGSPPNGPYTVVPKIRSPINTLIQFEIEAGENPATSGYSFSGEPLNENGQPLDPITTYTWHLGDDLSHPNSPSTKASYGVGGFYDLKLRVDTEFGAYRITTYEDSIDIVENVNLWMWVFQDNTNVRSYEYGLISETFKLNSNSSFAVDRNASFLNTVPDANRQKREFRKNTGFSPRGTVTSGKSGSVLLYWASGRATGDPVANEQIKFVEYNGFSDTYISQTPITRPWNWASFSSPSVAYFAFGTTPEGGSSNSSPTNLTKTSLDLISLTRTDDTIDISDFQNGAQELTQNPANYNSSGISVYGDFSVYRTAWKDSTGYIARNDGVGPYFRIKSFYRTEGSVGSPFQTIRKLIDIQGATKTEGQLSTLSQGIYFFNNSGSISAFSDVTSTWSTGGPGINSVAYRALQDTTVQGFDNNGNTLLAASDSDHRAYLSFDYSSNVFLKFSEIDLTFTTQGARPEGEQWMMGIY